MALVANAVRQAPDSDSRQSGAGNAVAHGWRRNRAVTAIRRAVLAATVVVGLGTLVTSQRSVLHTSLGALGNLHWWWVLPAIVAATLSMVSLAVMHRRLLGVAGVRLALISAVAVTYASNAISASVPLAGSEFGTAYTFAQYRRRGAQRVTAAWTLTVSGLMSSLAFGLIVALAAVVSGSAVGAAAGLVGTLGIAGGVGALLMVLRHPHLQAWVEGRVIRLLETFQRLFRRPRSDAHDLLAGVVTQMAALRLRRPDWAVISFSATFNWLADVVCLALTLGAAGLAVPWPVLILAWSAGATASSLGPTPGGLGIVEAVTAAGLVAGGLPPGPALAAVLVYRLISFWMAIGTGWSIYFAQRVSSRRTGTHGSLYR